MMDISRRVVVMSLTVAAAGGLALPALVGGSGEPPLTEPVQVTRSDATGSPDVPSEPVPVPPQVRRQDENARTNLDEDDDQPVTDDDDGGDDGPDRTTDRRQDGGGSGGAGTDDAGGDGGGSADSADSASGD
jgi:hypothetical protein